MKELREYTFHSRHLVPYSVGEKGQEQIIEWIEENVGKHRFTPGDEVCHKDNPGKKMYVKEILREIRTTKGKYPDKTRIIGIHCYFWDGDSTSTV